MSKSRYQLLHFFFLQCLFWLRFVTNNFFFQGLVAPFLARTEVTYSSTICPRYMIMMMTCLRIIIMMMTCLRNMIMMMMHQVIPPAQNLSQCCWSRKLTIHILPLVLINHDVLGICPNHLLLMNGTLTKRLHFQWYLGKPWKKQFFHDLFIQVYLFSLFLVGFRCIWDSLGSLGGAQGFPRALAPRGFPRGPREGAPGV